jgi:hypothetical protein
MTRPTKPSRFASLSIDELVDKFAEISIAQSEALLWEEIARFNSLYRQMDRVGKELKRRGDDARRSLMRLYGHPSFHVRLNAANRTLAVAPDEARRELRAIAASGHYPQAADAALSLQYLDEGRFRPT